MGILNIVLFVVFSEFAILFGIMIAVYIIYMLDMAIDVMKKLLNKPKQVKVKQPTNREKKSSLLKKKIINEGTIVNTKTPQELRDEDDQPLTSDIFNG
mgnify:CR=1 FL=1